MDLCRWDHNNVGLYKIQSKLEWPMKKIRSNLYIIQELLSVVCSEFSV